MEITQVNKEIELLKAKLETRKELCDNLQQRIDKAIEYMKNYNEFVVPEADIKSLILKEEYKKIIAILGDKEKER